MKRKEMGTRDDEHCRLKIRRPAMSLRMEEMLTEGRHSDVTFETDDGDQIPAHRCILVSVSPVFRAMFASPMIEETTRAVRIENMSSSGLRAFLRLLYTEYLARDDFKEFGLEVLAACHKYQTSPQLIEMVSSSLCNLITVENSVTTFEYGSLYDEALLLWSKWFIGRDWNSVILTPEFGDLAVRKPALLVELVQSVARDQLMQKPVQIRDLENERQLIKKVFKTGPGPCDPQQVLRIGSVAPELGRQS